MNGTFNIQCWTNTNARKTNSNKLIYKIKQLKTEQLPEKMGEEECWSGNEWTGMRCSYCRERRGERVWKGEQTEPSRFNNFISSRAFTMSCILLSEIEIFIHLNSFVLLLVSVWPMRPSQRWQRHTITDRPCKMQRNIFHFEFLNNVKHLLFMFDVANLCHEYLIAFNHFANVCVTVRGSPRFRSTFKTPPTHSPMLSHANRIDE